MYADLKSYRQAAVIYDFTVEFTKKYIDLKSRTIDQMVQAARSGKQNIVEGSAASRHSPEMELKLLGVARASLKELLEDYGDFLRQNKLELWEKNDQRVVKVRSLVYPSSGPHQTYKSYRSQKSDRSDNPDKEIKELYKKFEPYLRDPEEAANAMISLINQTTYLIDKQIPAAKIGYDKQGILYESDRQKVVRVISESMKKEQEIDEWIQQEMHKYKKG